MNSKLFGVAVTFVLIALVAPAQEPAKPKFSVKIVDDKEVIVNLEDSGAVDPTKRINFAGNAFQQGNFYLNISTIDNRMLHLSHFPSFMIDGRFLQDGQGGRFEAAKALPDGPGGKKRFGTTTTCVIDDIRITQVLELHPSKAKGPGKKRLSNNVLVSYSLENKGARVHNVGVRTYMDTYVIDNDGCLYAAPVTHPGRVLDGMVLEGKVLPPYLQMLQRPDLKNPGYVAHLTLNVGSRYEKATKLVLTRHGAGFGGWDMPAMIAGGDSAIGIFWPVKELKVGDKRDVAYVYGEGIAITAESEGRYQMSLGGSFEPGKVCTISAVIADPALGQTMTLELPKGMQRVEGREVQPVTALSEDNEYSTVLWKARVVEPGQHTIRIRSSTGVTQTKIVTVTAEK
ncbi:MAG: hypothetical protein EXR98_09810 [Gemmataceae bacterium]|nr:hypothetical protein [Gemmataceae bacterium]